MAKALRAPIELRLEDSLKSIALPMRRMPAVMLGVMAGSLAVHAVLLATAVVASRVPVVPPQQEIAVDIVQETPKPPPPKPAPSKPAQSAPVPSKTVQSPESDGKLAKLEPPKLTPSKPVPEAAKPPADAKELADLQKELAALRAQRAALKPSAQADSPNEAASRDSTAAGPLAKSLQAVALPSIAADGEAVGYQNLIFSQLAKAKGDEEWHGKAGTTGVHFEVDEAGRLLRVEVAVSSGSTVLDQKALDIVRRAAPFPPPPKDADHGFYANVNFLPPNHS